MNMNTSGLMSLFKLINLRHALKYEIEEVKDKHGICFAYELLQERYGFFGDMNEVLNQTDKLIDKMERE